MYELAHVANTILMRAKKENVGITPMKLQKLIYFLYGEYLCEEKSPLFAERFEVWKYGPVLSDVYQAFRSYGANFIRKYMPDANGRYQVIDTESDNGFRACFERVWETYGSMTGIELSKITHRNGGAWYKAASAGEVFLMDKDIRRETEGRNNERGTGKVPH